MIVSEKLTSKGSKMVYCNISISHEYVVMFADDYFYNFMGRTTGISFKDIIHPDYVPEFDSACKMLGENENVRLITFVSAKADIYQMVDLLISESGHKIDSIPVYDIVMHSLDSIEDKYYMLTNNTNKYRTILSMYNDYLFDYDVKNDCMTVFMYMSVKATPLIKCGFADFRQRVGEAYKDSRQREKFFEFCEAVRNANGSFHFDLNGPKIENIEEMTGFHIECKTIFKHNRDKIVVGVIKRADDDQNKEVPLYNLPEGKDSFTGLINKRACREYIKDSIIANNSKHYLLVIDADNFKTINDRYGHLFGDRVILEMASIFNAALSGRGIVSRFGGDEFVIFTNWLEKETQVRSLMMYFRQKLKEAFSNDETGCNVTLSIGVSCYPDDGKTYDELFEKADKCLYIAKEKGRNRYIIYDEQKHGHIKTQNSSDDRNSYFAEQRTELALAFADISERVFLGGNAGINESLRIIIQKMRVEGVRIYSEDREEPLFYCGGYKELPLIGGYLKDREFMEDFKGRNYVLYVNLSNFSVIHKKMFESFEKCGIKGFIGYYFEGNDGTVYYFFFDAINDKISWTESDRNYYLMISRMISRAL